MIQPLSSQEHDSKRSADGKHNGHNGKRASSRPTRLELQLLRRLLAAVGHPPLTIELWDGTEIAPPDDKSVGRLRALDRGVLGNLFTDPNFQFGEMVAAGRLEVDGPLDIVMIELFRAMHRRRGRSTFWSRMFASLRRPRATHASALKENIYHHYDLGNDFYRLWLDERMAYTCAYFPHREATLEEAQLAKFDHVCRKLRLEPEMVVVEAGCGWGGLAMHMAEHYGVRVRAYNISREQVIYARRRASAAGLDDRVDFIEDDWRNIQGACDVFVSVGMLEHVGRKNYVQLGRVIDNCLTPEGRGLIHTIGQNQSQPFSPWIERRIFPARIRRRWRRWRTYLARRSSPCWTWKTFAYTTPKPCGTGWPGLRSTPTKSSKCSTPNSSACGGSTWRAAWRHLKRASTSSSKWSSIGPATTT